MGRERGETEVTPKKGREEHSTIAKLLKNGVPKESQKTRQSERLHFEQGHQANLTRIPGTLVVDNQPAVTQQQYHIDYTSP